MWQSTLGLIAVQPTVLILLLINVYDIMYHIQFRYSLPLCQYLGTCVTTRYAQANT